MAKDPVGQGEQGSWPFALKVPGAHIGRDVQSAAVGPEQETQDGSHAVQVALPVAVQDPERYSPAAQLVVHGVHAPCPSASANVPLGHGSQAGALANEKVPGAQGVQVVWARYGLAVPAGQMVQGCAPVALY